MGDVAGIDQQKDFPLVTILIEFLQRLAQGLVEAPLLAQPAEVEVLDQAALEALLGFELGGRR